MIEIKLKHDLTCTDRKTAIYIIIVKFKILREVDEVKKHVILSVFWVCRKIVPSPK